MENSWQSTKFNPSSRIGIRVVAYPITRCGKVDSADKVANFPRWRWQIQEIFVPLCTTRRTRWKKMILESFTRPGWSGLAMPVRMSFIFLMWPGPTMSFLICFEGYSLQTKLRQFSCMPSVPWMTILVWFWEIPLKLLWCLGVEPTMKRYVSIWKLGRGFEGDQVS